MFLRFFSREELSCDKVVVTLPMIVTETITPSRITEVEKYTSSAVPGSMSKPTPVVAAMAQ